MSGYNAYNYPMFTFKAVLFDLDGTILDTVGDINAALNKTLGTNFTDKQCMNFVGNGLKNAIKNAAESANLKNINLNEAFTELVENYKMCPVKYTKPYPGVQEFLDRLEEKNISIGVFSNKEQILAQTIVHTCFPHTRFNMIVGMHGGYEPKPSGQAVLAFCEKAGCTVKDLLYVGDSEVDYKTAQNAGSEVRILTWGMRTPEQLLASGVPKEVLINSILEIAL